MSTDTQDFELMRAFAEYAEDGFSAAERVAFHEGLLSADECRERHIEPM